MIPGDLYIATRSFSIYEPDYVYDHRIVHIPKYALIGEIMMVLSSDLSSINFLASTGLYRSHFLSFTESTIKAPQLS